MTQDTILDRIIAHKCEEVARQKQFKPQAEVEREVLHSPPLRDFVEALRTPDVSLIAEVKKASPSKGVLCPDFDPVALARTYEANGAAALSVLTDTHFFQGSLDDLRAIRETMALPVLRKDFIIDLYQVYESRAAGADAILLIVAAMDDSTLHNLYALARHLGMAVLVEVHNLIELRRGLGLHPRIIGINNRDLQTFNVTLDMTAELRPRVPRRVTVVAESGIHTAADVARLASLNVHAMLVGEALVTARDVGGKVKELVGVIRNS
ncbi:MAG: indole-3-glycerol phosphate synthase TrpC [Anaerolineae bacterium]|nr:indole-3-glycerol phosphate synthase TrpC [Anaerolineae bacterium]